MPRPSPFPGMDPYLEEPALWAGVHHRLISSISDRLAAAVAPDYVVAIEQRVYIIRHGNGASHGGLLIPDVYVIRGQRQTAPVATMPVITAPTIIEPLTELEVRDSFIEIRDAQNQEIVTTIEVLSPHNKAAGSKGLKVFRDKRRTVMSSLTHWLEIDLLRWGERPPEAAGKGDYYALLKRSGSSMFEAWFFNLRDVMPVIAVPLRSPYTDVGLDLQNAFGDTYLRGYYSESIDYSRPLPPPEPTIADVQWVRSCVNAWQT